MPRPCAVETHARGYKKGAEKFCGCHGLAPWRFTFPMKLSGNYGISVKLHGARPWHLREFATSVLAASVKLHGARPWHLREFATSVLAASVKLHGARPWHLREFATSVLAASVRLHGARPWHLRELAPSVLAASVRLHGPGPWIQSLKPLQAADPHIPL